MAAVFRHLHQRPATQPPRGLADRVSPTRVTDSYAHTPLSTSTAECSRQAMSSSSVGSTTGTRWPFCCCLRDSAMLRADLCCFCVTALCCSCCAFISLTRRSTASVDGCALQARAESALFPISSQLTALACIALCTNPAHMSIYVELRLLACTALCTNPAHMSIYVESRLLACIALCTNPAHMSIYVESRLLACTALCTNPAHMSIYVELRLLACTALCTNPAHMSIYVESRLLACTALCTNPARMSIYVESKAFLCQHFVDVKGEQNARTHLALARLLANLAYENKHHLDAKGEHQALTHLLACSSDSSAPFIHLLTFVTATERVGPILDSCTTLIQTLGHSN
jgi:hypothetical protein